MMKYIPTFLAVFLFSSSAFAATDVPFTVNMSEAVNVSGCPANCPRIAVTVDGQTRYADYSAGSGTSSLTFTYSPTIGDLDLDGVTLTSPIDLNGGTITDLNGNALTPLTFTVPNTSGVKIDYPSLSMDFVYDADGRYTLNGTAYNDLSSFLGAAGGTFSRNSVATYFDSTGMLQTAANNEPRFDHDPITHAAKGLLMEEARTNQIHYSTDPSQWSVNGAITTPLGGTELGIFSPLNVASNGQTFHRINVVRDSGVWQPVTSQAIVTFYYKAGTSGKCIIIIYNTNTLQSSEIQGSVGALTVNRQDTGTITKISQTQIGSVYKISFAFTPSNTTDNIGFGISANSTVVGEDIIVLGGQIEYGQFATSFIPTTTTSVSRQTETLTAPVTGWYNQSAGTFMNDVSWDTQNNGIYPMFFRVDNGTSNERWNCFYHQSQTRFSMDSLTAGVNQGGLSEIYPLTGHGKLTSAQSTNDTNVAVDGIIKTAITSWTPPTVTQMHLYNTGSAGGARKWFKEIKYYPYRASDTQLQLLTQ